MRSYPDTSGLGVIGRASDSAFLHSGHQSDSMKDSKKDSKQEELIEEEGRWVESQILPPDVALFILKDETQRIRAAWSEKKTATHITN